MVSSNDLHIKTSYTASDSVSATTDDSSGCSLGDKSIDSVSHK